MTNKNILTPKVFKELAEARSIRNVSIYSAEQGLIIVARVGLSDKILGKDRGGIRYFKSFDGAAAILQKYGINEWEANSENWVPRTTKK